MHEFKTEKKFVI